jgi:hypothetical protein
LALTDIFAEVQPSEDPYHLAARLGFNCLDLETVDQYDTAKEFWDASHGDLMLTFVGGWLKVKQGSDEDVRAFVGAVADAAAIAVVLMRPGTDKDLASAAVDAAKAWARGEKTPAEVAVAADAARVRFDADQDSPAALLGAWSACMFVADFAGPEDERPSAPRPFEGDDKTYGEIASFVRASFQPPEDSPWRTY